MIELKKALKQAIAALNNHSETAQLDAELLLSYVLKTSRTYLYTHPELILNSSQWEHFYNLLQQRQAGQPIAYLVGQREFWSLTLEVNNTTLIPRPETELLVELALSLLKDKPQAKVLDLGTGSGAIALALASERPDWLITATDINPEAIQLAKRNAHTIGIHNTQFYPSNWFQAIPPQTFDLIISNPPYLEHNDPHLLQGDLRFEPETALVSGADGLQAITTIIHDSPVYLVQTGYLLIEHGYQQAKQVRRLLEQAGLQSVQSLRDLNGIERVSGGQKRSSY